MAYADQGISRNRMIGLVSVALIHVVLGWALVTGLAQDVVKAVVNKVEAVNIKEKAPPPEEPPPPPPKDIEIPPYVPPPEVTVASDSPPPPTITNQQTVPTPAPVFTPPAPPAPAPKVEAPPTPPSPAQPIGRGNTISTDDYPDASRRAEEQGSTRVSYTIGTDGKVSDCKVVQSSGFPRLDETTCRLIIRRYRFKPATRDGQPVVDTKVQSIKWQLQDER